MESIKGSYLKAADTQVLIGILFLPDLPVEDTSTIFPLRTT